MKEFEIEEELKKGGKWLGAARTWIQHNIKDGDKLLWPDTKEVLISFNKLEELALAVAVKDFYSNN